jgi:hypothetical protein
MQQAYADDRHAWAEEQAHLLRMHVFEDLDLPNLIEELEQMSASTRRELISRLALLIGHLLKWEYQPARRSRSWEATIEVQRNEIRRLLQESPSLRARLSEFVIEAYDQALALAWSETNLARSVFPVRCMYTTDQVMNPLFWPGPEKLN